MLDSKKMNLFLLIGSFFLFIHLTSATEPLYQCSSGFTVEQTKYDIKYSSENLDELAELKTMQAVRYYIDQKVRTFKIMYFLVKASDTSIAPNTIRVKLIEGDGTIYSHTDQILSDEIKFFEAKAKFGLAITKDNKWHSVAVSFTEVTIGTPINLQTQVQQSSSVATPVNISWVPLFLTYSQLDSNIVLFRQSSNSALFHSVRQQTASSIFIQSSITLTTDAEVQADYYQILIDTTSMKLYGAGVEKILNGVTYYGNERLIGMKGIDYDDYYSSGENYRKILTALWNFEDGATKNANIHLLSVKFDGSIQAIRSITTTIFPILANIQFHFSTLKQHFVQYDGQNLRYSFGIPRAYNVQSSYFFHYATAPGDSVQTQIAGNASLGFAFATLKMIILTDDQIHEVNPLPSYKGAVSSYNDPLGSYGPYKISDNLGTVNLITLERTINLGPNFLSWITNPDSDFVITKTQCLCGEKGVSHMECFQNSVCIFVAQNNIFDCSNVEYIKYDVQSGS